jgi:drug/metabolite transporter (DMT)-like permease
MSLSSTTASSTPRTDGLVQTGDPEARKAIGGVLVAITVFSAGGTMIKSTGVSGSVTAFWRLFIGVCAWQVYLRITKRKFTLADVKATAVPGLLFGINIAFFYTGIKLTAISHAEFMTVLTPLILIPLTAYHHKERIGPSVLVAGAAAIIGVLMIVLFKGHSGAATSLRGDAYVLASIALWIGYLLRSKTMRDSMDPRVFVAGMSIWAMLAVAVIAVPSGKLFTASPKAWLFFCITAIVNGLIGHGLLTHAQGHVPLGVITLLQLAQPPLSTLWAYIFLHEHVEPLQLVGMTIVLASVGVVAKRTARASGIPTIPEQLESHE